jgi:hypothetical protein
MIGGQFVRQADRRATWSRRSASPGVADIEPALDERADVLLRSAAGTDCPDGVYVGPPVHAAGQPVHGIGRAAGRERHRSRAHAVQHAAIHGQRPVSAEVGPADLNGSAGVAPAGATGPTSPRTGCTDDRRCSQHPDDRASAHSPSLSDRQRRSSARQVTRSTSTYRVPDLAMLLPNLPDSKTAPVGRARQKESAEVPT